MKYMVFAGYQPERAAAQSAEDSQEMKQLVNQLVMSRNVLRSTIPEIMIHRAAVIEDFT